MSPARARGLVLALTAGALAACSSAPPRSGPASTGQRIDPGSASPATPARRSPYAPAQEDPGKRGDYVAGGLYAPHIRDSAPSGGIPDIDLIPEPDVVAEPRSRYGNRSPYSVLGKSYRVLDSAQGYAETGLASYYGNKFHGRRTSNLEVYDMYAFSAAHKTLPLPSYARVTNLANGKSVVVRVNDRGPFHDGRIIDLSYAAAVKLGVDRAGTAQVEVQGLSPGEDARPPEPAIAAAAAAAPAAPAVPPSPPSALDRLVGALPIAAAQAGERPPASASAAAAGSAQAREWRFDMRQDGRTMGADEFDAWMRARRARVATGKPAPREGAAGVEAPVRLAGRAAAAAPISGAGAATGDGPGVSAAVAVVPPAAGVAATAATVADAPPASAGLILQVASFAAHANAERALALLDGAGIAGARLLDADANGRRVWRLRVGPVDPARTPELVARIQRLGFGQPQPVRE
ncbi:septal ring lytic transglycosylase RlpA family protein [Cognatiluteimonas weifangensis]|uniref:Endolytic peptidoglycan transglycosylase RlpA n=1 Tax=Cognatiluteimonas weifangensis TaxID=2303539 RepID=A0A372DPW4_9GAMM|nr:septal ring lytic transglycosylase RlpA family protein [Luteimonas weifangensis]RFP61616.1 septal ring lytic transglycosylase RlpA family protein [Luteimonas weifangensis]